MKAVAIRHELEILDELDDSFDQGLTDRKQFITKEKRNTIFVDGRSTEDKSVISATMAYDEKGEKIVGVEYGRCKGREALINWVNLDIGNMSLEEEIEERVLIRDPGTIYTATG